MNLFIESLAYVPQLSQTAGARIVIHNQGDMPFPDEEGINLVPGFSTSIGVRRVHIFLEVRILYQIKLMPFRSVGLIKKIKK